LANGKLQEVDYYEIDLEWDDEQRLTQVYILDGDPLLGVELLQGMRLTVEMMPCGDVSTEPL
jgi:hypothetical protein